MNRYCLGFAFTTDTDYVLLLKKSRTLHVGLWNGLGGKAEDNETTLDAMVREFQEEANEQTTPAHWELACSLFDHNHTWMVDVYGAQLGYQVMSNFSTVQVDVPDVPCLIPLFRLPRMYLAPHTNGLLFLTHEKLQNPKKLPVQLIEG